MRVLESVLERNEGVKDMHKTLHTNKIAEASVSSENLKAWLSDRRPEQ
jgi:hypothetical protein